MSRTILVVDDTANLRDLLRTYLEQEGFRVVTATNGQDALYVAREARPDLIILDLMMPEMGGYEFMRSYSREGRAPIIILTAKLEENDRVLGLELGADDYVTKPFSMRELAARVRAVLRRIGRDSEPDLLRAGDLMLDQAGHRVTIKEEGVALTPTEFELLAILMRSPGRAFSRWELLDRLQGEAVEGMERTIDVHVRNLRTKIEAEPANPRFIETVYGIGYRFADDLPTPASRQG